MDRGVRPTHGRRDVVRIVRTVVQVGDQEGAIGSGPALDQVAVRTNLQETAFFFPHLVTDADGTVRMEFTMPEALTEWKFLGFAHDTALRAGGLTGTTVTAKDLMVQPNPPRFLREGDLLEFTVKVSNQSPTRQAGTVRLSLSDAQTNDCRRYGIRERSRDQSFDIPAGESRSFSWKLSVPERRPHADVQGRRRQ